MEHKKLIENKEIQNKCNRGNVSYYTRFSAAVSLDAHILYDIHTSEVGILGYFLAGHCLIPCWYDRGLGTGH